MRVLRSENPLQFIFYYANTRGKEYLDNIIKDINPEYIQFIDNLKTFKLK